MRAFGKNTPAVRTWFVLLAAAAILAVSGAAMGQDEKKVEKVRVSHVGDGDLENWIKRTKQPVDWLKWGADMRIREVWLDNNVRLDKDDPGHQQHFQRYRFRIWATLTPMENFNINARLMYGPRHFCKPDESDTWRFNEAMFDELNFELKNLAGLPLSVKIGRGGIRHGEGWLVMDGSPLDGSRTVFFDAARVIYDVERINTKFDVSYVFTKAQADRFIEPFGDKEEALAEDDSHGLILYVTNKSLPNTQIDGYYIFKHDEPSCDDLTGLSFSRQQDAKIHTFGVSVGGEVGENWKYRTEMAQQFGRKEQFLGPKRDLCAWGFNGRLEYHTNDKWKNNFRVAYEYLSGDGDPEDGTDNAFDPLWGRWPHWSEILIRTYAAETRLSHITNLHRFGLGWTCSPLRNIELCTDYHLLFADKNPLGGDDNGFSRSGGFRGQLLTGLLRYKISDHINTHALAELFCPGDYYDENRNDVALFLRYQIVFTW